MTTPTRPVWSGLWEQPGEWVRDAVCAEVGMPDVWFPTADKDTFSIQIAKRICRRCPVRDQCRDYALRHEAGYQRYGVYGGMSPAERRKYADRLESS